MTKRAAARGVGAATMVMLSGGRGMPSRMRRRIKGVIMRGLAAMIMSNVNGVMVRTIRATVVMVRGVTVGRLMSVRMRCHDHLSRQRRNGKHERQQRRKHSAQIPFHGRTVQHRMPITLLVSQAHTIPEHE